MGKNETNNDNTENSSTPRNRYWSKRLHFDSFGISSHISVSYIIKDEVPEEKVYHFLHYVSGGGEAQSDRKQIQDISLNLTDEDVIIGNTAVKQYIDELVNTPDQLQCTVNNDGEINFRYQDVF
ncbi:MAG: hypothetical protein NC388_07680 [Clostridium sp.]|nr:hypothetical protein [Clostridium sp.]